MISEAFYEMAATNRGNFKTIFLLHMSIIFLIEQ